MSYVLISDTHVHKWSAFSTTNAEGINSRLQIILDETLSAAAYAKSEGINTLIHAGDLFHVRGQLAPSVLNPTLWAYRSIIDSGMDVIVIAGNHDLEGKTADDLGSAISALKDVGVRVINETTIIREKQMVLIPWIPTVSELKEEIEQVAKDLGGECDEYDLIIHAPVDGVIAGIPDHGLTAEWLDKQGFKRVFSGHYHNHKHFDKTSVWSIGALTHQTWGDVGTKAGSMLVHEFAVEHRESHAPKFIDLNPNWSEDEVFHHVDGNYVRARVEIEKESQAQAVRDWLFDECGAAGVVVHPIRKNKAPQRNNASVQAGASLEASVHDFVKNKGYADGQAVTQLCAEILRESEGE